MNNKPVAVSSMISNRQKLIGALLIFCVCSSKNFFIYNEEVLVTCSFVIFCWVFYSYFRDSITQSLNSRSDTIKMELQNFIRLKQDFQGELIKEHKTIYNCSACLDKMASFFYQQFRDVLNLSTKYSHETAKFLVLDKLRTCSQFISRQTRELQIAMVTHLRESLSIQFSAGTFKQMALLDAKAQLKKLARGR